MKIGIIGATGNAGKALFNEAIEREHEPTAIVRNKVKAETLFGSESKIVEKDAFDLDKEDLDAFDAVVVAFAADPEEGYLHIDLATRLVHFFRNTESPRLVFILGAGSLKTGDDDHLVIEDIKKIPDSEKWIQIPESALKQLLFLNEVDNVNWVGISPGITFLNGEGSEPIIGKDHLLYSSDGESHTTSGTLANAILNELEEPKFYQERFTAVDQ